MPADLCLVSLIPPSCRSNTLCLTLIHERVHPLILCAEGARLRNPDFLPRGSSRERKCVSENSRCGNVSERERGRSDFQVGPGAAGVHFGCACPKLSNTCSIQELWLQRACECVCVCAREREKERKRELVFFSFC